MRIILSELQIKKIVNEVLKDEIPSYMSDIIQKRYKNVPDVLDRDVPQHTDKIPNVKVQIEDEKVGEELKKNLRIIFTTNLVTQFGKSKMAEEIVKRKPLIDLMGLSLSDGDVSYLSPQFIQRNPSLNNMAYVLKPMVKLYSKEFLLPTPESNDIENPLFSKNKSGLATFLKVAKKIYPELNDLDVESIITDRHLVGLRDPVVNLTKNLNNIQSQTKLYLYITDKPDDKLRMSLSKYYDSCQNLYSGGDVGTSHNKRLLSNVFDVNSKVAYLIYDAPFTDNKGNEHPFTSIARTIIRVGKKGGIMFDRVYPGNMEKEFYSIIEDKTGLINTGNEGDTYHFHGEKRIPSPYMDKYKLKNTNNSEYLGDNPKVQALGQVVTFDIDDVEEMGEDSFRVDGEHWQVETYDVALEKTKDFLYDTFSDINDGPLDKLIYNDIFGRHTQPILDLLKIDEDYLEDMGYAFTKEGLIQYLDEFGYKTLDNLLNLQGANANWLYNSIDMDNYIKYFGGEFEAMKFALAREDGQIHEVDKYYIYTIGRF
jgi:hypothetical protein